MKRFKLLFVALGLFCFVAMNACQGGTKTDEGQKTEETTTEEATEQEVTEEEVTEEVTDTVAKPEKTEEMEEEAETEETGGNM